MAATVVEFTPRAANWGETCLALDGIAAAIELLLGLRAGRVPVFDEAGCHDGWESARQLYLCAEGRDKLKSVEYYLHWRHVSLCGELGSLIVAVKL